MGLIAHTSELEHRLVLEAEEMYKEFFAFSQEAVQCFQTAINSSNPSTSFAFMTFYNQVNNSLTLALLSFIRRHTTQGFMILRYALESGVLASYALHNTDIMLFGAIEESGYARQTKVQNKAYKWLEEKHPARNERIKYIKDRLNQFSTHANIIPAFNNVEFHDEGRDYHFFDLPKIDLSKSDLWLVGHSAIQLLLLFEELSHEQNVISFSEDFTQKLYRLVNLNNELREIMISNPILSKHIKP